MNARTTCLAIVLAAGEGTRMRSSRPKVLHAVAGRSLLAHVLAARARGRRHQRRRWWSGPDRDDVAAEARAQMPDAEIFVQRERRGTAHAVLAARAALEARRRRRAGHLRRHAADPAADADANCAQALADGAAVAVLGFRPADPTGYGRLVTEWRASSSPSSRTPTRAERERAHRALQRRPDGVRRQTRAGDPRPDRQRQSQGRILPDRCGGDRARAWACAAVALEVAEDEVSGINTKAQLAEAEAVLAAAAAPGGAGGGRHAWSRPTPCFSAPTPSSART